MSRFSSFKVEDAAGLAVEKKQFVSKFFEVGLHEVKVKEYHDMGPSDKDPDWFKVKLVFEGANEKTINHWLLIPTKNEYYVTKDGLWPFRNLVKFIEAIVPLKDGKTPVTSSNVGQYIAKLFDSEAALLGKKFEIKVGFDKHHPHYVSKGVYALHTKDGIPVLDTTGSPITASSADALSQYAEQNRLPFDGWAKILGFGTPQDNAVTKKLVKPVEKPVVQEAEDVLF